jgi:hypothetical protein
MLCFMFLNAFIGKIIQKSGFGKLLCCYTVNIIFIDILLLIYLVLIYVSVKFVFTMQLGLVGSSVNITTGSL